MVYNSTSQPDRTFEWLRIIHWATAFLVIAAIVSINARGPAGTASLFFWANIHFWVGCLIIILTTPRLLLRLWRGSDDKRSALAFFKRAVHMSLLVFLLVQPALGILTVNALGAPVILYGTGLPIVVIHENKAIAEILHSAHRIIGLSFYWVIGLHICVGLYGLAKTRLHS